MVFAGVLMALLLVVGGCGSSDHPNASASASPNVQTAPARTATVPAGEATTENGSINAVLAAIRNRDAAALVAMVRFTDRPCVLEATALPGGPLCVAGEKPGAVVPAFLVVGCPAAHYARAPELPSLLGSMLPLGVRVYAVGRLESQRAGAAYVVTLLAPAPVPQGSPSADAVRSLDVSSDGAVLGATFSCPGVTPSAYLASRGITTFLLAPQ